MADDAFEHPDDPDFPAEPAAAARLRQQLQEMADTLPASYWQSLQRLLPVVEQLHSSLWRQPALNALPGTITDLTGLTRAAADELSGHLATPLALMTEVTLRGGRLYYYVAVARHLLDTPLGGFVLRLQLTPTIRHSVPEALLQPVAAVMAQALDQWLTQLWVRAGAELTELDPDLLQAQLASAALHASSTPGRFLSAFGPGEAQPWPPLPATDEPTRELVLPGGTHLLLRLGSMYLLAAIYRLTSPWVGCLLDQLSPADIRYLQAFQHEASAAPDLPELRLALDLPAAADLHRLAHLAGVLAASRTWEDATEIAAGSSQPGAQVLLADLLPAGISLPAPDPSLRYLLAGHMSGLAAELEELFGADAPPLAANRAVAARLAELG